MILDWLLRHHRKDEDMLQVEQNDQDNEQLEVNKPVIEQTSENAPVTAEPKTEEKQGDLQSKLAATLDDLTLNNDNLANASRSINIVGRGNVTLASPSTLNIEAPIHAPGAAYPVSDPLYTYASLATKSAVDKLEAAYQDRIFHMRILLNHLGHEAEAEVMALFDKHPITVD